VQNDASRIRSHPHHGR